MFCRRTVLQHLSTFISTTESVSNVDKSNVVAHFDDILGKAIPLVSRALTSIACSRDYPDLRETGLWKLAVEALVYVIEDTLPALERCNISSEASTAYWQTVATSVADVVAFALPDSKAA